MAGHRRRSGKPTKARTQHERRRAQLNRELAVADKLVGADKARSRFAAAADYLRGALARTPDAEVEHLVEQLVAEGERLYRQRVRREELP